MRCNNCNGKLNKRWKVCLNCGNKIVENNLPFKMKHKEWIDKHLVLVNVVYCFPINLLYTLLPALLVYMLFTKASTSGSVLDINNTFVYLIGISGLFPFLLMMCFILFLKSYMKSFKIAKYAVQSTNNKKYYMFIILDVIGIMVLGIICMVMV